MASNDRIKITLQREKAGLLCVKLQAYDVSRLTEEIRGKLLATDDSEITFVCEDMDEFTAFQYAALECFCIHMDYCCCDEIVCNHCRDDDDGDDDNNNNDEGEPLNDNN